MNVHKLKAELGRIQKEISAHYRKRDRLVAAVAIGVDKRAAQSVLDAHDADTAGLQQQADEIEAELLKAWQGSG